jgi:hypothetical protein
LAFSINQFGEKIQAVARLKAKPLCVYGSETVPTGAVKISTLHQCLPRAIFFAANQKEPPILYFGKDALVGCCPGGTGWTGYSKMAPMLEYFVSTGNPKFRNGEAEYLKASPRTVVESKEAMGEIRPLGTFTVVQACSDLTVDPSVKSVICFGNAEQIRNLCALIHFRKVDPFCSVSAAWGPTCATLLTYPAGIAENAPSNMAYLGPTDPTGNAWFPEDFMALGIPLKIALDMCEDADQAFITKRTEVVFPHDRNPIR